MRRVTVLALLTSPADRQLLQNIISHSNWNLRFVATLQEAQVALRDGAIGVVISDRRLSSGGYWTDVLGVLETLSIPPRLIIAEARADSRVWAEVLSLGAYDLLMKPFDAVEVLRTVSAAWLSWKDRLETVTATRKPTASAAERQSNAHLLTRTAS